jgi:hypothetical protein
LVWFIMQTTIEESEQSCDFSVSKVKQKENENKA